MVVAFRMFVLPMCIPISLRQERPDSRLLDLMADRRRIQLELNNLSETHVRVLHDMGELQNKYKVRGWSKLLCYVILSD